MKEIRKAKICLSGKYCGNLLEIEDETGYKFRFEYDDEYFKNEKIPVSLTMPLTKKEWDSKSLPHPFHGLIPEGWLLDLALRTFSLDRRDKMGLLLKICQDNIGAIEVYSSDKKNYFAENEILFTPESSHIKNVIHNRCLCCLELLTENEFQYHTTCCEKLFSTKTPPHLSLDSSTFEDHATHALKHKMSLTGVQIKFSGKFFHKSDRRSYALPGAYIFKPEPAHKNFEGLASAELLGMTLAKRMGLVVASHGLIYTKDNVPIYVTRRFDREESEKKIHTEDFSQILGKTYGDDKYTGSHEQVLQSIKKYCGEFAGAAARRYAFLTLFNFLIGNADNHHKNHALIIAQSNDKKPFVHLAPAYDLHPTKLFIPHDEEETALTMDGSKKRLNKKIWLSFFKLAGIQTSEFELFIEKFAQQMTFVEEVTSDILPFDKANSVLNTMKKRLETLHIS